MSFFRAERIWRLKHGNLSMNGKVSLGLDIGTSIIKVVALQKDTSSISLVGVASRVVQSAGLQSESLIDWERLAQEIKETIQAANAASRFVHAALPENQVYTKVVEMPNLSDRELSSAIRWEAEQYIPLPMSEAVLDYQQVARTGQDKQGKMQVLLVAAPLTLIHKYQKIMSLSNLTPLTFEPDMLATIRVLIKTQNSAPTFIIDTGTSTTNIAIVRFGMPVFSYSLNVGGNAITKAIATEFGFDLARAEEYKQTYGFDDTALQGKLTEIITPVLSTIVQEVKKGIEFYQERYPQEEALRRVIISGGIASLPKVSVFFTKNLGIEVEIANPWSEIAVDSKIFSGVQRFSPMFTVATGLALRGLPE